MEQEQAERGSVGWRRGWARASTGMAALAVAFLALIGLAGPVAAVTGYNVIGTAYLNMHTGPSLSAPVVGALANGTALDITCQTTGSTVLGSAIWDRLSNGYYISDWYTTTPVVGGYTPGIARCTQPPSSQPTPTSRPTTWHHRVYRLGGVNMQDACERQYPSQAFLVQARPTNVQDPNSWGCFLRGAVPTRVGGINVVQECRAQYTIPAAPAGHQYGPTMRASVFAASAPAYGWGCWFWDYYRA